MANASTQSNLTRKFEAGSDAGTAGWLGRRRQVQRRGRLIGGVTQPAGARPSLREV